MENTNTIHEGVIPYTNTIHTIDNLELLKQLPSDSIDLIYCDILYNTGRTFDDYNDNLGSTKEAIEWYKPRLIEMKRVLKDTGNLYLHMDFRLSHYIKVELDKLFGEKNFINEIIWSYRTGGVSTRYFQRKHDTILRYVKSARYTHNPLFEKSYLQSNGKLKDMEFDEHGGYRNVHMRDVWDVNIIYNQDKQAVGYNTQKPKELLRRIIESSSNKGDLVADFFCGSGTTGVVALEMERDYIMCDINPRATAIAQERIDEIENVVRLDI